MVFRTAGDISNPTILLLHAMFVSGESFNSLTEYLEKDYFVIIPTYDGHNNDESIYPGKQEEAAKILSYLENQEIRELEFILGTSMGAIIALEVFLRSRIKINKVFLDGGPFFQFPSFIKKMMFQTFWKVCANIKKGTVAKNSKYFEKMPAIKALKGEFLKVCKGMKKMSVLNTTETCYNCIIPDLEEESQRKLIFLYGSKEPAFLCLPRLRKYKHSTFLVKKGYTHCEYLVTETKHYAALLKKKSKN